MIDIQQATELILASARSFGTEKVPLQECLGRILAQDMAADRDFPPFHRVTMDGIAIFGEAYESGQRIFPVQGTQAAGAPPLSLNDKAGALEVMTGAMLPAGADTVIRYEDIKIEHGQATIVEGAAVKTGQNVHLQGTDRRQSDIIVKAGAPLSPAELGVAATVGLSDLYVQRMPRAVIVSTGDELVPVSTVPAPYQIRTSNAYTIQAALRRWGVAAELLHISDELEATRAELRRCLQAYDFILLSGGVSKGKFDYVPAALADLGVKKHLHKVKQRPGKPFWFGELPGQCTVFALPGNPVSSFMCTQRYVGPWLRKCLGQPPFPGAFAMLDSDFHFRPDLTYFLQVRLYSDAESGRLMAAPVEGKGSGDLANLADADAFLELPRGQDVFPKGGVYPVYSYR